MGVRWFKLSNSCRHRRLLVVLRTKSFCLNCVGINVISVMHVHRGPRVRILLIQLVIGGFAVTLSGCAVLPDSLRGNPHFNVADRPIRKLVVVVVPTDASAESWEQITNEAPPKDWQTEKKEITSRLEATDGDAAVWAPSLLQMQGFQVISAKSIEPAGLAAGDAAVPPETLQKIRSSTGADAVFRFHVTDVGAIPKIYSNWIMVGTVAFVSGVVVLAYSDPVTRKFIGVYLLSEVVQEGAEAYGGYSLVDHFYRFVRVEAELIDTRSGKIIWQDAATCAGKGKMLAEYPVEVRDRTETKISVALRRALGELAASAREVQQAPGSG